ncbi:MAG: HAMP domain-containing sensor histidine kinase [Actinomycetota bacterium]
MTALARLPFAAIELDEDARIVRTNELARELLGDRLVVGEPLALSRLDVLAKRLLVQSVPLRPVSIEVDDGRSLRVSGIPATAIEPAIMLFEELTEDLRRERTTREFLRNAAHQLRTPLTGITAAIDALQAGAKETPDTRDRFLGHIEAHAERLTRLTRGLLLLARAQAGEAIPVDVVELRPLLDAIVEDATPLDGVTLDARCPPALDVIAAGDLLYEAVAALVDNALEHTTTGTVRIKAKRAGANVLLVVTDTGPGIGAEFQERLFEPFYRVSQAGTGYGLGLAIAAEAVEAIGGQIDVSSELGTGTIFTMTLPSAESSR